MGPVVFRRFCGLETFKRYHGAESQVPMLEPQEEITLSPNGFSKHEDTKSGAPTRHQPSPLRSQINQWALIAATDCRFGEASYQKAMSGLMQAVQKF